MDSPLSSVSFSVESNAILSTENETPIPMPAPAVAIPIPPATADNIVHQALERDSLTQDCLHNPQSPWVGAFTRSGTPFCKEDCRGGHGQSRQIRPAHQVPPHHQR